MDPFSIIVGTVGLADVSIRVISYLGSLKSATSKIQDEITILGQEIEALVAVNDSVEDFWHSRHDLNGFDAPVNDGSHASNVWKNLASLLQQSKMTIEQLEILLKEVVGKKSTLVAGKLDGLRKTIRRQDRDGEYMQIRQRLANNQAGMQMLLSALNLSYTLKSHSAADRSVDTLPENLQHQNNKLAIRIKNLRRILQSSTDPDNLHDSLISADAVASLIRFNKHFDMPQTVSSYYTGRQKQLNLLKSTLDVVNSRDPQDHQKRFVIYGLGGSGKTQFCCKFAQDNREHFWGVFWIDGSSYENAKHSFAGIAKIGGVEPNENAAKNWFSSLQYPWLLLIDNADDPEIDVMRYFPSGERGVILITTRNPANKGYGTDGSRFFHFDKLETEEASDLLLAAAACSRPWGVSTRSYAARAAEILGYLPLALIHAGKAILEKLCSLSDYPEYYERTWNKIRRSRSRSPSRGQDDKRALNMSVYSSYEMIYLGLESKNNDQSRDALELLKTFSFFYWENIEFDLLKNAASNPRREREDARAKQRVAKPVPINSRPKTWGKIFHDWAATVIEPLTRPSIILPAVLRDEDDDPFDEDRLRSALSLLVRLGMLTLHDENNSYWMHPLVHTWVRQRPETSTAEQAVWCQAAATILAQSIFFQAPRAYTAQDEKSKREIYPHVENVRKLQADIKQRFEENQRAPHWLWPLRWLAPQPGFGRLQATEYAKFSLVYLHCGYWSKAEELQLQVKDYLFAKLGPESEYSIAIAFLLSKNYVWQTRNNEARVLQYEVLESAKKLYGPKHPTTLQIMDTLGATCILGSRYREANRLHQEVIESLSKLEGFGPEHEDTWTAVDNLSKVKLRYFEHEAAVDLQRQAYEGMLKRLGPTHEKTLEAKDNLAAIYGFIGEEYLPLALQMSEDVTLIRKDTLGHEHPLTLKSTLTVAKIKTAMNQFKEAEEIFLEGLPIAKRNLGENHLGTLTARTWLGHLYWRQERYSEAQEIWEDIITKQTFEQTKRADGGHGDRVQAMWFLVHCYEDQGKIEDALNMTEDLIQIVSNFGGEGLGQQHKLWISLNEKKEEILKVKEEGRDHIVADSAGVSSSGLSTSSAIPPKKVVKDFTF
ncbi:Tetratricopeptide-like helical [Penicillium expansum]|uniref:Tetratricopeptide-like helical n=1 Tax=Penicillium expansum TaxID=27334 RepID=A0A0A2JR79_PENEN|nr:Tetratricopeptide-like helical [Penicillium expansum]KGO57336.1 Tetratricopeptide-like helical [Penicillium expansum]